MAILRSGSRPGPPTDRRSRMNATNSTSSPPEPARYRVEDKVSAVGAGDVLFCAARVAHGFEDISDDFCVWVLFYGPKK